MFRSWQNETFHLLENTPKHFFVKDVGALSSMAIPLFADSEAAGDAVMSGTLQRWPVAGPGHFV